MKNSTRHFLRRGARFLNQLDVRLCAAIADWWLVRIHFDDRVVDAHRRKRRQNVLDRVHADRAFADGGGALDRFHIFDPGIDRWFILQIFALKLGAGIRRRRLQFQDDLFAGMQRNAGQGRALGHGMLKLGR